METTWKRFVQIDIFVTLAGFITLGGWYAYWFNTLSDVGLLGAMIMFALDFFGLALLALAALVLLVSQWSRSHWGVLLGAFIQLLYGGAYTFFLAMAGGFITPGFVAGPIFLTAGIAGAIMCLTIPTDRRGWERRERRTPPPGEFE